MRATRYLSCAETAKLVRKALKREFPGVKFSVRSRVYSGGASIRVRWTDGPTESDVKAVAGVYAGGGFDGMIDMAFSVYTWLLPDGSAQWGRSSGTGGQRGSCPGYDHEKPHPDAELVRMGADFVFCDRDYTVTGEQVGRDLCDLQGVVFLHMDMPHLLGDGDTQWLYKHVWRLLSCTTFKPGEVYAGVHYTPNNPDVHGWCGIITRPLTKEDAKKAPRGTE